MNNTAKAIHLPEPGTFALYAKIREASKYSDQAPAGVGRFEVKLGADGYWHGNDNRYRTRDLLFFWFSDEAGDYLDLKLDR
jgi:hypothetical protein